MKSIVLEYIKTSKHTKEQLVKVAIWLCNGDETEERREDGDI